MVEGIEPEASDGDEDHPPPQALHAARPARGLHRVLTEVVFNWPGIGLYAVKAISYLDYSAIIGVTIVISLIYVMVNFIVDCVYLLLDPRISYRTSK